MTEDVKGRSPSTEWRQEVQRSRIDENNQSFDYLKTLVVFSAFSVFYLKENLKWNYFAGFGMIVGAVFLIFKKWWTQLTSRKVPEGVDVFEVPGPFLMGALHKYVETMRAVAQKPRARIIILRKVSFLDPSDFYLFDAFCRKCWKDGIKLILVGVRFQPLGLIKKSGLYDTIGPQNICKSFDQALKRIEG